MSYAVATNIPYNSIAGMDIVVTEDVMVERPRMQLSDRVCEVLTPAMIADHNQWMREFFGVDIEITNPIGDGDTVMIGRKVYMNPRTFAMFKNRIGFDYRG